MAAATPIGLLPGSLRAMAQSALTPHGLPLIARPLSVLPRAEQLAWQRDERALFLHFGVNTFTGREWGDGKEDPAIFNPAALDTRQWARSARSAGRRRRAGHYQRVAAWRLNRHRVAARRG